MRASHEPKSLELKKHVAAVHSSNQLTLVQRKIANALLYNAYDQLMEKSEHQIHVGNLCRLIGYDSKDYQKIKQALVSLISTVIEWNLVDRDKIDDEGVWNASAIIADASLDGPVCTYSYSNKMKQLLYRPEFYARLNMQVLASFKSSYGLALYENCIRYQDIGQTARFTLPTFRKLMGVSEDKYLIFRDFKRRVLDKAISEVNQYSPISVSVKLQKMGRQVTTLQFFIKKLPCERLQNCNSATAAESLMQRLKNDYGLSDLQIGKVLSVYEEKYIVEKMAIIESSPSYQNGKIINLAKYLNRALEEDYQPPRSSKENVLKQQRQSYDAQLIQETKKRSLEKYLLYRNREIMKVYSQLNSAEKSAIEKQFEKYIHSTVYSSIYSRSGMNDPLIEDRFYDFVVGHRNDLLKKILTYEQFCTSDRD